MVVSYPPLSQVSDFWLIAEPTISFFLVTKCSLIMPHRIDPICGWKWGLGWVLLCHPQVGNVNSWATEVTKQEMWHSLHEYFGITTVVTFGKLVSLIKAKCRKLIVEHSVPQLHTLYPPPLTKRSTKLGDAMESQGCLVLWLPIIEYIFKYGVWVLLAYLYFACYSLFLSFGTKLIICLL